MQLEMENTIISSNSHLHYKLKCTYSGYLFFPKTHINYNSYFSSTLC